MSNLPEIDIEEIESTIVQWYEPIIDPNKTYKIPIHPVIGAGSSVIDTKAPNRFSLVAYLESCEQPAASLISSISDEFHDPEPEL